MGDLLDAALAIDPPAPTETAADRRRRFRAIEIFLDSLDRQHSPQSEANVTLRGLGPQFPRVL